MCAFWGGGFESELKISISDQHLCVFLVVSLNLGLHQQKQSAMNQVKKKRKQGRTRDVFADVFVLALLLQRIH